MVFQSAVLALFLYHKNTSQNATKKQDDIMVNRIKKTRECSSRVAQLYLVPFQSAILALWNFKFGTLKFSLLFLLVVVRVVDTLHKGFAVVDFVGQSGLQKSLDIR